MPEDREWSWVGEDGVVHGLGEDELTFALSSEEIPAYAFVSHKTWAEWLPAMQVAELLWALPSGHADAPRKAEVLEPGGVRSPPPIADLPATKARFEDIRAGRVDPKSESHSVPRAAAVPMSAPPAEDLDLRNVLDSDFDAVLENIDALGDGDDGDDKTHVLAAGQTSALLRQAQRSRGPQPAPFDPPPRDKLPSFGGAPKRGPRREMPSSNSLASAPRARAASQPDEAPHPSTPNAPRFSVPRPGAFASGGAGPAHPSPARPSPTRPKSGGAKPSSTKPAGIAPSSRAPRPSTPKPSSVAPSSVAPSSVAPSTPKPSSVAPPSPRASSPAIAVEDVGVPPGMAQAPAPPRPPSPSAPVLPVLPHVEPESPSPVVVAPRPPAPSTPELARPAGASRPSLTEPVVQLSRAELRGEFKRGPRPLLWLLALVGLGAIGAVAWFSLRAEGEEPVAVMPTVTAAPPPPEPKQVVTVCKPAGEPTRLFDFAKPEVKPVWGEPIGAARIPLGFAQTSRLALGLMVSAANLSGIILARQDDPSPMLSVVPRAQDGDPEFLVERAASRLQTARAVAAPEPFAIGLRGKMIGARLGKEDVDLWPSTWETLSVPEVERIDEHSYAVAVRGGGLRGSVLLGKVTDRARAIGDLVALELAAARVGEPALAVGEKHVLVALDAGPDNDLGQLFVGAAELPKLPKTAQRVTGVSEPAAVPSIVALPEGGFFLQWTEGPVGAQHVRGRVFDEHFEPRGETFALSPPEADAHHGVTTRVGDRLLTVYFVRLPTNNHELWANALTCSTHVE